MRILITTSVCIALAACGTSNPYRDPVAAGARAPAEAQAAESHVRNHMAIDACPPGFHAVGVDIKTGSSAYIGIRNGSADSSSAANGQRAQKCVRN